MVTAVTRNLHQKGYVLKTQGNPGYLDVIEENIFDEEKLNYLLKNKDICINLIGILFEKRNNTFQNIHVNFPSIISKICKQNNIEQFIHISALGIENAQDSKYARSKLEGEKEIKLNFYKTTILRPSIVYSVDDNFTTQFMTLLNRLPFFPLYYKGETKFTPIHCSELAEIILQIINKNICSEIIECVGPQEMTFNEILQKLLKLIDKKKLLIPIPLTIAKIMAMFFQLLPKPLLTLDQLKLLKYDSILSGNYKSNLDIGYNCKLKFEKEVEKYCYMWKEAGQYSKRDLNSN
jgi:NADH dehydrogenase